MLRLPNELLPAIAAELEFERDINALARANWRFFSCLNQFLYLRNIQYSKSSALKWSAIYGQERTAKKPLEYSASCIGEALLLSIENGHEGVTRVLLSFYLLLDSGKVEPDSRDSDGRTPLSQAASKGYESIVKMLLYTGKVEVDSKDKYSRTPLSYAISIGSDSIVELLLDTGKAEIDSMDNYGRTPLSQDISRGYTSIVWLLLDQQKAKIDS
ncbi:putative ankyrin repeat-containing protein [Trichoderma evansii]